MTLESIDYKLGRIEGQLAQLLERLEQLPALEKRVSALENFRWHLAGGLSVCTAILTSAATWFLHGRK